MTIIKQNWNQLLLVVKATDLKQQISNPQIQRTNASDHIYANHRPVVNVKASFCASVFRCDHCKYLFTSQQKMLLPSLGNIFSRCFELLSFASQFSSHSSGSLHFA